MNTRFRKLISYHKIRNLSASIDLYVKRKNGERGFIQLELTKKKIHCRMEEIHNSTTNWTLLLCNTHQNQNLKYSCS